MDAVWGVVLIVLGGFLGGGAYAMWKVSKPIAVALAGCTVLAAASGFLRLGYF